MRGLISIAMLLVLISAATCGAGPMDEVNYWRRHNGLPPFQSDPKLMAFAQMKAEYRARRALHDGHRGPRWPDGCTEGTGECMPIWGWFTCAMEDDAQFAGAGIAVDARGERYMVLEVRNSRGPLIGNVVPINTSFLTPNPVRVDRVARPRFNMIVNPPKLLPDQR